MTKAKAKAEDLFGEDAPKKVQGGYTGPSGGAKPKSPTTESGVAPAPAKPRPKKRVHFPPHKRERKNEQALAVVKVEPAPPMNLLSLIGQSLVNPAIDTVKLREIVDWYDKREADNAFARDYLAMAKELPEIKRDGTIDQGITRSGRQGVKSKYATWENIHEATSAILQRHGFTLSSYNSMRGEETVVVLRLEHYDQRFGAAFRESIRPIIRDDSGGKTAVQADGSGEQYLKRRMVISILNLRSRAPEDRDLDGADPAKVKAAEKKAKEEAKTIDAGQLANLRDAIKDCGVAEQSVLDKYGLAKLEEMTVAILPDALKACANFKAARHG